MAINFLNFLGQAPDLSESSDLYGKALKAHYAQPNAYEGLKEKKLLNAINQAKANYANPQEMHRTEGMRLQNVIKSAEAKFAHENAGYDTGLKRLEYEHKPEEYRLSDQEKKLAAALQRMNIHEKGFDISHQPEKYAAEQQSRLIKNRLNEAEANAAPEYYSGLAKQQTALGKLRQEQADTEGRLREAEISGKEYENMSAKAKAKHADDMAKLEKEAKYLDVELKKAEDKNKETKIALENEKAIATIGFTRAQEKALSDPNAGKDSKSKAIDELYPNPGPERDAALREYAGVSPPSGPPPEGLPVGSVSYDKLTDAEKKDVTASTRETIGELNTGMEAIRIIQDLRKLNDENPELGDAYMEIAANSKDEGLFKRLLTKFTNKKDRSLVERFQKGVSRLVTLQLEKLGARSSDSRQKLFESAKAQAGNTHEANEAILKQLGDELEFVPAKLQAFETGQATRHQVPDSNRLYFPKETHTFTSKDIVQTMKETGMSAEEIREMAKRLGEVEVFQ